MAAVSLEVPKSGRRDLNPRLPRHAKRALGTLPGCATYLAAAALDHAVQTLRALFRLQLALAPHGFRACRVRFVVEHRPRAAAFRGFVPPALVLPKTLNEILAMSHVELAARKALQDIDEIHGDKNRGGGI